MSDNKQKESKAQDIDNKKDQTTTETPDASNVYTLPEDKTSSIDYDTDLISRFFDMVFHAGTEEGEAILTYASKSKIPAFPISEYALTKKLSRSRRPMACYYSTATALEDPDDGKLYNRQKLFSALHVVVLDDVGTKVPRETIPKELEPTYIIESSPNNFQYGYVLEDPIEKLHLAAALIQFVYSSGLTDGGGAMPNKIVRLPVGVNGKEGDNALFPVRLVHMDGPKWTPERLLDVIDCGTTWDAIKEDAAEAFRRSNLGASATAWSPLAPRAATLSGIIDPVIEHLYEVGDVVQDSGDWFTIRCPWGHNHTSGSDTATYSPMGYGEGQYANMRSFHCFHDHCSGNDTKAFLAHIAANTGIIVPAFDPAASLIRDYIYDMEADKVWNVTGAKPYNMPREAFKIVNPDTVLVTDSDGKEKRIKVTSMWLTAKHRVDVLGVTSDFTSPAMIIKDEDSGALRLNIAQVPAWGDGPYNDLHVKTFTDYLHYLIPNEDEYNYFVSWLSAKAQDLTFRGAGVLMVTEGVQGVGRNTLADMMARVFGSGNITNIGLGDMVASQYNEWQESLFTVTDETLSSSVKGGDSNITSQVHRVYESLKEIIDPKPKMVTVNPKYGRKRQSLSCTSTLMFSNHANAVATASGDRRIYVIQNAAIPMEPAGFVAINKWINSGGWEASIWRWLRSNPVDVELMNAPAPVTAGKALMAKRTGGGVNAAIDTLIELSSWEGIVSLKYIRDVLADHRVMEATGLDHRAKANLVVNAAMRSCGITTTLPKSTAHGVRIDGKVKKFTGKLHKSYIHTWASSLHAEVGSPAHRKLKDAVAEMYANLPEVDAGIEAVLEALEEFNDL